jgi:alpha-tubulin suppressor-like RCC1 family protein
VTQIAAGTDHTCARLPNGQARCWGYNDGGRLGDGTELARHTPVVVRRVAGTGALAGVTQIEGGDVHTCARLNNGQARCWGSNGSGQLGDGTVQQRLRPVVVKNTSASGALTGVAQVTASTSASSCAVLTNGQVRCWGDNTYRQLGHGTAANAVIPQVVDSTSGVGVLTGVREVVGGYQHVCASLRNGQARCWGSNVEGQLGIGTIDGPHRRLPRVVKNGTGTGPLANVTQIALHTSHTCVRVTSGQARCWGYGTDGQLGNGLLSSRPLPVQVKV